MFSFVYRLTDLYPTSSEKYYVGKHTNNSDEIELGKTYFTSSKRVSFLWKNDINRFKIKIVKIFETSEDAIRFESKYHNRLNVSKNPLFYNLQNQQNTYKHERDNLVTVHNLKNNFIETITCDEYYSNLNLYEPLNKNKILAVKNNIPCLVDKQDFINLKLHGINYDKVYVTEKDTGKKLLVSKEVYKNNKNLYDFTLQKMCVYDTINKKFCLIDKSEFDKNRYVGVNKGRVCDVKQCNICGKNISLSNFERHIIRHSTRYIFISNYIKTLKVSEYDFYTIYKNNGYFEVKNYGYINHDKISLRVIGKLIKGKKDD